jgi:RimJ/RimL family protein N-acetyltransferase
LEKTVGMDELHKIIEIYPKDFHKCFSFWDFEDDKAKQMMLANEINDDRRKMFAYLLDGEYVGGFSISLKNDANGWFLSYLIIEEALRNKGIGSYIIDYSIDYVKKMGEQYIYLRVHRDNTAARRLYERKGFILFDDTVSHRVTMVKAV